MTTLGNEELKECPFCGSNNIFNRDNGFGQNLTGCEDCGARVYYKFSSLEDAMKAWNIRPLEDALRKQLEVAMKALEWYHTEAYFGYEAEMACDTVAKDALSEIERLSAFAETDKNNERVK